MKVALIHDYIKEYGGAERVLEVLHEIWPEAPVFTTVYLPQFLGPHKDRFKDWDIRTSRFQNFPYIYKLISPLRLLAPWYFDNLDLREFDVIITSATGAYFPNLIVRPAGSLHICYCHTPPRYLYGYPTARNWQNSVLGRFAAGFFNHFLRQWDFVAAQRPDYFVANSNEVKRRIEKYYRREATVIYPPVDNKITNDKLQITNKTQISKSKIKKEYYLTGGRLARAKRIDLAIEACNKLKVPLKVFGRGFADYGEELRRISGPTIEFLGEVSEDELVALYQGAKALIYPSEQEDFGIMPVEAMSTGVPVVALNQGGVKETVVSGKTGVFFDKPVVNSVVDAIKRVNKLTINPDDCIEQAKKFSKDRFKKEMQDFISSKLKIQMTNQTQNPKSK